MPAVRQSQMKRIEELVALCAAGPGTLEQFDAAIAVLDATEREVALRCAGRRLAQQEQQLGTLREVTGALEQLRTATAYRAIVLGVEVENGAQPPVPRVHVSLLGAQTRLVAGAVPGVRLDDLQVGDEVDVVQTGPQHYAVRRRVGRHVRHGRAARIEQVIPPGLLRVQHGPETVVLRPAGAVAATLAELGDDASAIIGRLVTYDEQLGLAFELFGDPDRQELVLREYPTVRQSDLVLAPRTAGLLERLVLLPTRRPELARRYGVDIARFCIFAGPPGVGKTHAGRWLAAELGMGLFLISGSDIASEWYSVTEARLRARLAAAAKEPAGGLVFWDEAESMLIERGRSPVGVEDRVVATLLAATDGFVSRGNVLVVLTTNRPDKIDVALRRSLRAVTIPFERPDARATRALFHLYLREVRLAGDDAEPLAQAATRAVFAEREPIGLAVLRDGSRVPLPRAAAISGALVRASCEEASRRAFVRDARGEVDGSAGVARDDLLGALADELAAIAGTLTPANLAHAVTLPPGVADQVVAVEQPASAGRHQYVADN